PFEVVDRVHVTRHFREASLEKRGVACREMRSTVRGGRRPVLPNQLVPEIDAARRLRLVAYKPRPAGGVKKVAARGPDPVEHAGHASGAEYGSPAGDRVAVFAG